MGDIKIDKSNKKIIILTYLLLFSVLYGVCNTEIYYAGLMPFGIGIVFALFFLNFNGYMLGIVYFISYSLAGLSVNSIIVALNVVVVLSLLEYLKNKRKIRLRKWLIFVFAIVSQILFVITNIGDIKQNLALFVSLMLGLMFLYSCLSFFEATFNRGFMIKLNLDEKICGCVILIIFIIGMACTNISIINLGLVFVSLIILTCTFIVSGSFAILISGLLGIGFSVVMLTPDYISMFVVMSILAIGFKCNFKYLSIFATILGYILFSLFFEIGFSVGEVISVLLGGLIFAFIPKNKLFEIADIFGLKTNVVIKDIINRSKKQIVKRVEELSVVFNEMDKVYRDMVRGVLSEEKAIELLKEELISSVCDSCPNKNDCFRGSNSFLDNAIDTILNIGYEKGRVLLIDLPSYLTSNCIKINQLVNILNNLISSYKEYSGAISNLDTSRILIADQLNGVSKLLKSLSTEVDVNINFDTRFENCIKEELSYKNIICLECAVYEKDIHTKFVNLIVKTDTIDDKHIEKIVTKIIGNKMMIVSIEQSEIQNASVVSLRTRPNYDIAFGSAVINKRGKVVSGDSHSFIKIEDGKFMVSICDGMGSGEQAHNISKLTISLIENFYKAGFDNEIILSSVNKLLSLNEQENFSTIDLCVIDGRKNIYDFIKLGASTGYLKRDKGGIELIQSSGLPVGVLEEIRPHITKKLINPMDMLVFVSDGVADIFESDLCLKNFINNIDTINPQTLSNEILNKALELSNGIAKDDMTVLCVRVFNNV